MIVLVGHVAQAAGCSERQAQRAAAVEAVSSIATVTGPALYDRELTDVFAVQDEVTREIVDALKVKLSPDESPGPKSPRSAWNRSIDSNGVPGRHKLSG